jgi:MFS family permease
MVTKTQSNSTVSLTGLAAALHFCVDGLCLCCLYLVTTGIQDLLKYFVVYNVLAFLTQPLTGMLADRAKQRHWILLSSIILLILAVIETVCVIPYCSAAPVFLLMLLSALLGIGNSLFHVWGGKETAVRTGNDIRALGVFVSTGAFGLAVSSVFLSRALIFGLLLGICILALAYLRIDTAKPIVTTEVDIESKLYPKPLVWVALILIMFIVAGRSFTGESFTKVIDKTPMVVLLIGALTMMGKMAGGWLVKWLGMVTSIILLLVGVTICIAVKGSHIGIALVGLFMVNCTMPITLYWANVMLKGREGLAFGLLAASLIPGYLIVTLLN